MNESGWIVNADLGLHIVTSNKCYNEPFVSDRHLLYSLTLQQFSYSFQDTATLEQGCLFKVDEYGFFIYWKSEGKVGVNMIKQFRHVFGWQFIRPDYTKTCTLLDF